MAVATDELVYKVGLIFDKVGFNGLNASIDKSIKAMAVASAAALAASSAIFAMGKNYAQSTDELIKISDQVNSTTSDIQKLTFAAEDNGATMDDVTSSLGALAKAQEELLRGRGDFEAFGRLGVNPTEYENTSDLIIAISDSVQGLGNTEAIDLMGRVGISPKLLQTLQQGGDGLRSLGKEAESLGIISTPSMLKSSQTFMSGWQRATTVFNGVMNKVSSSLLDSTINPALASFNKFASKHMKQISSTLIKIFDGIAKASEIIFSTLNRLAQPFIKLVNLFGGLENAAKALAAVMLIVKRSVIMAMLPGILAVGALYLAFDELMSFLSGEESFIGDFFKKIGVSASDVKVVIESIGIVLAKVVEGWKLIFTDGGKAVQGLGDLIDRYILEPLRKFDRYLADIDKKLASFRSGIKDNVIEFTTDALTGAKNFFGLEDKPSQSSTTTNNNAINIQIDGSKDPILVKEAVVSGINEYMNNSAQRAGY